MSERENLPWFIDTHVWLWLLSGDLEKKYPIKFEAMQQPLKRGEVFVSAISLWEVAMLDAKKRIHLPIDCLAWILQALKAPGVELEDLSPQIAVASAKLADSAPRDPSDRIIIASAMSLGAVLVTQDREMINYAENQRIPCLAI